MSLIDGDRDLLREITMLFSSSYHKDLRALQLAVAASDAGEVSGAAHKLKGAVGNLCARPASVLLDQIEAAARSGDLAAARQRVRQLERELERVLQELERIVRATDKGTKA